MRKKRGKYKHLTKEDRIKIEALYNAKHTQTEIAAAVGVNQSTISRELKKGLYEHLDDYKTIIKYSYDKAQLITDMNTSKRGPKYLKIDFEPEYIKFIVEQVVKHKRSPQVALEEAKKEGFTFSICVNTFYNYIDMDLFEEITLDLLPTKRKRRKRTIGRHFKRLRTDAPLINDRPKEVENREVFGHWEMDTVKGRKGKTKGCMLVLTERKTRKEIIKRLKNQKAESVVKALDEIEKKYGNNFKNIFKTITVDNGVEFADYEHMIVSIYGGKRIEIYYCHPYSSWERGTNENNNRMIRRFIPKGKDFDNLPDKYFSDIEEWMNNYPRRMFDYRTAADLFEEELSLIG